MGGDIGRAIYHESHALRRRWPHGRPGRQREVKDRERDVCTGTFDCLLPLRLAHDGLLADAQRVERLVGALCRFYEKRRAHHFLSWRCPALLFGATSTSPSCLQPPCSLRVCSGRQSVNPSKGLSLVSFRANRSSMATTYRSPRRKQGGHGSPTSTQNACSL